MNKRFAAVVLLVTMVMSLMTACKANEQKPAASVNTAVPETGYDGSPVTIKFAHTMGDNLQNVLDYHIGRFNERYPNITVEHSTYGGWRDIAGLINTEIIGDNQPNVAYCYPDHVAAYNMSRSVVILDDLINSTVEVTAADGTTEVLGLTPEQIDSFIDGFYDEGRQYGDGLMYTLPMSKSTEVLFYNKTFFEENGLSVPNTWEEMELLCEKILQIDPGCIPLGYDSEDNWFINLCEQYGYPYTSATGEHYLFNNEDCKSFVKKLRQWYQKGYVTTEALYGSYTSGLFTELDRTVSHSYMCIGSSGGASYQVPEGNAFEVGVAPIPQVSEENRKVISQGPSLCILKGRTTTDQQILASWLFVKFLTTDMAFQTDFSTVSGYMPVLETAQEYELFAQWLAKANGGEYLTAQVVKLGLDEADTYFTSPAFNGSSVARAQVGTLLAKCMSEPADNVDKLIDDAFRNAYEECVFLGS